MADKHPTQAVPQDGAATSDTTNRPSTGRGGGGESGGGPYPNPHTGKGKKERDEGFGEHGGQTDMGYHGPGQLGDKQVGPDKNTNAASKSD